MRRCRIVGTSGKCAGLTADVKQREDAATAIDWHETTAPRQTDTERRAEEGRRGEERDEERLAEDRLQ